MKVLVAHNRYRLRGGEDVVAERECALLEEAGFAVTRSFRSSEEIRGPLATLSTALHLAGSETEKRRFREELERVRPEIVHVHNTFPLLTPSIFTVCREAGVPCVYTLHNYRMFCANGLFLREGKNCELCLERKSPWPGVRYACYRDSRLQTLPVAHLIASRRPEVEWAEEVSAFVCATEFARGKFVAGGLPAARVHVKRHFSPDLSAQFPRREEAYFLYVGRLSEEKGVRTLLAHWPLPKERLVFVGDGPLAAEVRAHGHPLHTGLAQNEVFRWMSGARALVMPSECYESAVPLVLLEALSLGVPVITSRFGAADEVFRAGENAWVFAPGAGEALREAVLAADQGADRRREIGLAGRATYEKLFRPETNLERLKEIYGKVLGRPV